MWLGGMLPAFPQNTHTALCVSNEMRDGALIAAHGFLMKATQDETSVYCETDDLSAPAVSLCLV